MLTLFQGKETASRKLGLQFLRGASKIIRFFSLSLKPLRVSNFAAGALMETFT
jgi:hypothetical protein